MVLAIVTSGLLYYFLNWYTTWYLYFYLLLLIPGLALGFFLLFALFLMIESHFIDMSKKRVELNRPILWCLYQIAFFVIHLCRIRIKATGGEKLPKDSRFLLVSNHQSGYDHLCFFTLWPRLDLVAVTKPENEKLVFAGRIMHQAGFIPINRDNPMEGIKSIVLAIRYIKENKASIAIAPEGTRSHDGLVHEFHPGSFKIATKTGCPLAIVAIQNADMTKKRFPWRSTKVYVDVLEVLSQEQYKDMNTVELAAYSQKLISDHLNAHIDRRYK